MGSTKMHDFYKMIPQQDWQKVGSVEDGMSKLNTYNVDALVFDEMATLLGDEGCEELMLVAKDTDKLSAVAIGANEITHAGAAYLSTLLQTNDSLLYFNVYNNDFGNVAAMEAFAQAVAVNRTLVALQLASNNIGPDGAMLLARELEFNNRTLLQLDLSLNLIQNDGAKAFGKALKTNDILTTLLIGHNEIGDEGAIGLMEGLKVNYSLAFLDVEENTMKDELKDQVQGLLSRNMETLKKAFSYANECAKDAPLRKAKLCFIGKDFSGKSGLIRGLMGKAFTETYDPTAGVKMTQVQARLNGQPWYRTGRAPAAPFTIQFLSRFANIKLDRDIAEIEKQNDKAIGFAGFKKKANRRGSVQQRRVSISAKKTPGAGGEEVAATKRSSALATARNSRRSSVAQTVLNAVLGPEEGNKRKSVKDLFTTIAQPFRRKFNDLLDDNEYQFEEASARGLFSPEELDNKFDVHVLAKARRERDNLGFNICELSGNRVYYTMHHAFLTEESVYVLVFDMSALVDESKEDEQKDTIRYLNYWLKVVKYHSPDASLAIVGTHADEVDKEGMKKAEHYISRLVFPEMHKMGKQKQEALKVNEAIEAANQFAKMLEEEAQLANEKKDPADEHVDKKTNLLVNEHDRKLFFPVDLMSGKGYETLRLALDNAAQKQKYFNQKVPLKWLKFLDAMRTDSTLLYCSPNRVKALAFQTLDNDSDEMNAALELFNELGYIIHITEIEQLKDTVITDTLRFHNKMFKLVFNKEIASFDMKKAQEEAGLSEDIEETLKNGIISQNLLNFLWDSVEQERKFFLQYAQLTLMMAQYKYGNEGKYIVPSLVPARGDVVRKCTEETGDGINLQCQFSFKGFLTLGVYERLVCLCIQYSGNQDKSKAPILAMGWSQHYFGEDYVFRLERQADDILVQVIEANKSAPKLIASIEKMFLRLKQFLGKGFIWECLVDDNGQKIKFSEAKKRKATKWFA